MNDKITHQLLNKYFKLTSKALSIVKENIVSGKEKDADEIISMVDNYLSDAKHFEEKGELVLAYGALNYAHGWLDSGVRLGVFDVDNDKLFTVR
ncbi:DUF357 domain-containing protein [Candidatus Pacearchaeota archaeon CG10_big_fil_rev_8_21_14_0_10_31_9]|nr:MAG: DUF357 domain-containing protein [Candidatus Pacearchaeota archaeon CG10_big_fil_rev_8_21_14_0_10_31_9]